MFRDGIRASLNTPPVLSFFTGGGFLDLGFESSGFRVAWSNEYNPLFAELHDHAYTSWRKSRDPGAQAAKISDRRSVTRIQPEEIVESAFGGKNTKPDIFGVVGGPPCTDFSIGGQQAGSGGSAGRLTGFYVGKLLKLRPAFFVLENVPGLVRNPRHLEFFRRKLRLLSECYHLHEKLLQALETGVPQDRERLFLIGIRKDLDPLPKGMPFAWPENARLAGAKLLLWPRANPFKAKIEKPPGLPEELMVHTALGGDAGVEHLPNGNEWFVPYSKKFLRVFEGFVSNKSFKRLHRYRYSPTAWYGNNEVHLHPTEARRLSVRETLRLQSVPDSYVLPENAPLSAKFKIICNGVPVRLAEAVAVSVKAHLLKIGCLGR
jgi:DNA (cytosine-5)-methyltransferase 1